MDERLELMQVHGGCPHVNRDDHRCASRFGLTRIDQAFDVCFGTFQACPMYHRINGELDAVARNAAAAAAPVVTVTAHGRPIPLRATGT